MSQPCRCSWVNLNNPAYVRYHDREWGKPHTDDAYLFEFLILESFQAGLSWECVLNKREAFRKAFDDFDYQKIAAYDEDKLTELAKNPGIIRHKQKIRFAVNNARIFIRIQKEYGSFSDYIWHFTQGKPVVYRGDIPHVTSPLSDAVSADLRSRGMRFVGSKIMYAYLQAVGVINDHEATCSFG